MADNKDWTWVLERRCPECGFAAATLTRSEVGSALRAANEAIVALLDDDHVRARPADDVWSALEYGAHVRDVNRLYLFRLGLMLAEDGAHFPNWDQDVTAAESRYDLEDPAVVRRQLADDGEALAAAFDALTDEQWTRTGFRSDGAHFTVDSFGRYLVHDPTHHVWDIEQGYRALGDPTGS